MFGGRVVNARQEPRGARAPRPVRDRSTSVCMCVERSRGLRCSGGCRARKWQDDVPHCETQRKCEVEGGAVAMSESL
eukprot:5026706-Pleurochrysis_carterae.AAC.1